MDWATIIITGLATAAAIASAVVAIVQARAARSAKDESVQVAAQATKALDMLVAAQTRANDIREREIEPDEWAGPRHISGDLWAVTNASSRPIKVELYEVQPDEAERFFTLYGKPDDVYDVGDSFEYMSPSNIHPRPQKFTITWRYVDDPATETSRFIIPI
jgi:hypothetical protein